MNEHVNIVFLKKNNLFKVTIFGILFWLTLLILTPVKIKHSVSFLPFLLIFINYLFFFLGYFSLPPIKKENVLSYSINRSAVKKALFIIIAIALFGVFFKLFDKFYLREGSFNYSMSENRVLLEKAGASVISIISAIINPLALIPLFLYHTLNMKNKWMYTLCLFLFFSASFEFLMLGSRSGLFVLLVLFAIYLRYFKKLKITYGRVIIVSVLLFFLGIYSVNLFIERTNDFTKDRKKSIKHILTKAGFNYTIEPSESIRNSIINSNNETFQVIQLGFINFSQYYLHGVYEFNYMYNNYSAPHYYGAYTFNVFAKFINIIFRTDIDLQSIQKAPPRTGIYTTFFGPIFIDFGWFSFLFMFLFGFFQKYIYNQTIKGRFQFIPLLFYLMIINFFLLVINFINGAQGIYIITGFLLFAILYILLTGKLIISKRQYVKILK